ncbi:hypothetical protein D9M69_476840 [compost metagenome]
MPWLACAASHSGGVAVNGPSQAAAAVYQAATRALPRPAQPGKPALRKPTVMHRVASSSTVPSSPPHRLDSFK